MNRDEFEETFAEDTYHDTSMFNAEEIVRKIEEVKQKRRAASNARNGDARRRFENLMDEKRLADELKDSFDDFDF